jgi:hypothetical protein
VSSTMDSAAWSSTRPAATQAVNRHAEHTPVFVGEVREQLQSSAWRILSDWNSIYGRRCDTVCVAVQIRSRADETATS